MLLEQLRDFEWLNEPDDVDFDDSGMMVVAKANTDFWQNNRKNIHKNDGHFFFSRRNGNFVLNVQWNFRQLKDFEQCGIMLYFDERNWMKASIMTDNPLLPKLGCCVTNCGYTDWAMQETSAEIEQIYFRIKRSSGDYTLFYSLDGIKFVQIRWFNFQNEEMEIKAGAYIASPKNVGFQAQLQAINFEQGA